ncbi:MAG: sigma-54 dependent transcriptional regulator [Thermoanaerobaculia bacterium]|nr:sigma-54 dependent transcriptional regulator [Thermoanaerobaculia bacterium]
MDRVLLVEDEPSLQLALGDCLGDAGYAVTVAGTVEAALEVLGMVRPDLVLCDLRLPDGDGMTVLAEAPRMTPEVPIIILTAYGTVQNAVEALRAGASEYLTKPFEEAQLLAAVKRHLELGRLRRRVEELEGLARPIGSAPAFRRAVELAATAAASDTSILLLGETGTGKEVVARFVHDSSPRRRKPFVAVNCAALPESLLESELFGHERGAFTGAIKLRRGRFEEADGGTLFLDEVAEASPAVQAKLLRALEQQRFERVGSSTPIQVDVRLVAATRRDLSAEVAAGRFRDDLYYRLKVVPVSLPPLRERKGDVPLLAQVFAQRLGEERRRPIAFSAEALEVLERHRFPGNVRELLHLVQRLAATCDAETITTAHLPEEYAGRAAGAVRVPCVELEGTLAEMTARFERIVLLETLERHEGHRGNAAQALGISRKNLWEKLKALGIEE